MVSSKSLYFIDSINQTSLSLKVKKHVANYVLPIKSLRIKPVRIFPYFIVTLNGIYWNGNSITFFEFYSIDRVGFCTFSCQHKCYIRKRRKAACEKYFFNVRNSAEKESTKKNRYCVICIYLVKDFKLSFVS